MKKIVKLILSCMLLIPGIIGICAEESTEEGKAESFRYHEGNLVEDDYGIMLLAEPYHSAATLVGIDVSEHQGKIDWEKVKTDGIDFAIIRCGYGMDMTSQDDLWFQYNVQECERVGMPYGIYIYSYATTVERASSEADHVLRLIEGCNLSYPVYYDMEDGSTIGSNLAAIAKTFCNKIEAAGYPVGVYANLNWWNNYLTDPCFNQWHRWVAQYNTSCGYRGDYAMWQYTSSGSVNGISGRVDMNFQIGYPDDHGVVQKTIVSRKVIQTASCTENGIVRVTYSDNSYIDFPVIANGHKYEIDVILPDCKNPGYTLHTCLYCGDEYKSDEVDKKSHRYGEFVSNQNGTMTRVCADCGDFETVDDPNASLRLYGETRYETSFLIADELKQVLGVEQFDSVIVASGTNFADALAGSYLAAKKDAPILITNGKDVSSLQQYIQKNLKIGGTIYILGGTKAVSDNVVNGLNGYAIQRLAGADRYETNLRILKEAGIEEEEILIATGKNFADSLSASASNRPILLVDKSLTKAQKEFLSQLSGNEMIILGGESAVSEKVEQEISAFGKVTRIGGATRYETSKLIADKFYPETSSVILAYAKNFPDGLCGGSLASAMNAPLILTQTGAEAQAKLFASEKSVSSGVVLGGPGLISDEAVRNILSVSINEIIQVK